MEVGLKIKKYLEEKGISQAYVARECHIDTAKLNLALNGNRKLTFDEYEVICGVIGVNTDYFIKPRLPNGEYVGVEESK